MEGKLAIVFGGSGDLGQEIIRKILLQDDLRDKYHIISTYYHNKAVRGGYEQVQFNATEPDCDFIESLKRANISHVFFCIGIAAKGDMANMALKDLQRLLDVNAISFLKIYQNLHETFRRSNTRFSILSSMSAVNQRKNYGAYSLSKAALESIVKTLVREEESYGVTFNIFRPSTIDSKLARNSVELGEYKDFDELVEKKYGGAILKLGQVSQAVIDYAFCRKYRDMNGEVISEFGEWIN